MEKVETFDDASSKYDEIYVFWQNLPNEAPPSQEIIDQKITEFKTVENMIISEGLISPNEDFEDLLPETLKYLVMPIILADLYTRKHENRLEF